MSDLQVPVAMICEDVQVLEDGVVNIKRGLACRWWAPSVPGIATPKLLLGIVEPSEPNPYKLRLKVVRTRDEYTVHQSSGDVYATSSIPEAAAMGSPPLRPLTFVMEVHLTSPDHLGHHQVYIGDADGKVLNSLGFVLYLKGPGDTNTASGIAP